MPTSSASGSSCRQPGLCPLSDHAPLELGQGGEDVEDQLATAGGGVDLLGEALEADPSFLKSRHRLDQVRGRSCEKIHLPDDDGVPAAGQAHCFLNPRPVCPNAAGVSVNSRSQPACVSVSCWSASV
jgi:hypothetical protein